jgi:hypothetical protein
MTPPPIGLMLLRVWSEPGSAQPLRIDVRQTTDLSRGFQRSMTLADVDAVVVAVRRFLEGRQADAPGPLDDAG